LDASEEEATSVVAQWQETVTALETSKNELTIALEKATETQKTMQAQIESLQTRLKDGHESVASVQTPTSEGNLFDWIRHVSPQKFLILLPFCRICSV
jgi:chromosome segregation ATPase